MRFAVGRLSGWDLRKSEENPNPESVVQCEQLRTRRIKHARIQHKEKHDVPIGMARHDSARLMLTVKQNVDYNYLLRHGRRYNATKLVSSLSTYY